MVLILIAIVAVLFVVFGLLLVIFALLNPWAVVAMFGMVLAFAYFKFGQKPKKLMKRR